MPPEGRLGAQQGCGPEICTSLCHGFSCLYFLCQDPHTWWDVFLPFFLQEEREAMNSELLVK